jgi:glycosyltransferase involved in cell wall biosynthesis
VVRITPQGKPFVRPFVFEIRRRQPHHYPMPKLTIVTVTFNDLAGLVRTRASVLACGPGDWEHVIVDGGSTDGTVDYLRGLHPAPRWTSERDKGPYDAMNKGARAAAGEWTLFLNSGDTLASAEVLGLLTRTAERTDADLIYGNHFFRGKLRRARRLEDLHVELQKGDAKGWLRGHPCHQAVIARTARLLSMPFDLSYRIAADFHWMERLRQQGGRSHWIDAPICVYQPGGLSARSFLRCTVEWWKVARLAVGPAPGIKAHFLRALRRHARRRFRREIWRRVTSWLGWRRGS